MSNELDSKKAKNQLFLSMLEGRHNSALAALLQDKNFRFYAAELLGFCKTFESAFSEKGNVAAYQNGMQAVGQKIFNDIMLIDPSAYLKMCEEEKEILALKDTITEKED